MKQLHEIVTGLLQSRGLWKQYQINKLILNWGIMVGRPLSEVTQAKDFSRGRLRVLVIDSVWGHHLSLMKPQIIKSLNSQIGDGVVKEIYFQVGELLTAQQQGQQPAEESRSNQFFVEEPSGQEFKLNIKRLQNITTFR